MNGAQREALNDAIIAHGHVQVHFGIPECAMTLMTAKKFDALLKIKEECEKTLSTSTGHDDLDDIARALKAYERA